MNINEDGIYSYIRTRCRGVAMLPIKQLLSTLSPTTPGADTNKLSAIETPLPASNLKATLLRPVVLACKRKGANGSVLRAGRISQERLSSDTGVSATSSVAKKGKGAN